MSTSLPSHIGPDVEFGHTKETHHRFAVILLWWMIAVSVLLAGMAIGPAREFIESVDDWWLELMVDAELGWLIRLGDVVALVGSTEATVPIRLGVAIWLGRRAAWDRLGVWVGAIVLSEATLSVLKAVYGRARPPIEFVLEVTTSSSFPSGHVIAATAMAIALVYVFAKGGKPARHWFYVAAAYAMVMALSRTYLRVHWLSDVTVGIPVGAAAVMTSVWVVERFKVGISGALESAFGWGARKKP